MAGLSAAAAALAATVAFAAGLVPAAGPDSTSSTACAWRQSASRLYQELAGEQGERPARLRKTLADAGVDQPKFVPQRCRATASNNAAEDPSPPIGSSLPTAAARYGWGTPSRVEQFNGDLGNWNVYDGPGHAGKGRRTPAAASTGSGTLTITGDSAGATAGMAWLPGQKYGRWEGRVKAPAADKSYNALLLLWPDAENFPVGGEVDFMEMMDHTRQATDLFLHFGSSNSQVHGQVELDATQWHNWALEWTPSTITAFVDGEPWWSTTDTTIFPPGPMHLCIQLDWFPKGGAVRESTMQVDWVKQYPLGAGGPSVDGENTSTGPTEDTSTRETGGDSAGTPDAALHPDSEVADQFTPPAGMARPPRSGAPTAGQPAEQTWRG